MRYKRIYQTSSSQMRTSGADLGFQGADKGVSNIILPFKKPKKSELSEHKKEVNKQMSALSVKVEHAFNGIKRLKVIRNKIRLKSFEMKNSIFRVATAMHNFRLAYRGIVNHS